MTKTRAAKLFGTLMLALIALCIFAAIGALSPVTASAASTHTHDNVTFEPWSDATSLPASGSYYLTTDVALASGAEIETDLNLCLNGHTVTVNDTIDVTGNKSDGSNAVFSLYDCKGTGMLKSGTQRYASVIYLFLRAEMNFYGGTIDGNDLNNCVQVYVNAIFNMYGGTITNGRSSNGGGVFMRGHFNMYGGTITNNTAASYEDYTASDPVARGGGVYVGHYGQFKMYGGKITNNTAVNREGFVSYGGGVCFDGYPDVWPSSLYGGEISNNTADFGGGVYVEMASVYFGEPTTDATVTTLPIIKNNTATESGGGIYASNNKGWVTLANTTIEGNRALNSHGGGIYYFTDALEMENVTIRNNVAPKSLSGGAYIGTAEVSGSLTATGNTTPDGAPANLSVSGAITVSGTISADSNFGISHRSVVNMSSEELSVLAACSTNLEGRVTSDDPLCRILRKSDNSLHFGYIHQNHTWADTYSYNESGHYYACICDYPDCQMLTRASVTNWLGYRSHSSADTPTCVTKKVCTDCGHSYGDTNPNNHETTVTAYRSNGDDTHTACYTCCNAPATSTKIACSGGTANCISPAICKTCKSPHGAIDPATHANTLRYISNGDDTHTLGYKCCNTLTGEPDACRGGTAKCTTPAKCSICYTSYGDINPDNHTEADFYTVIDAKLHYLGCVNCDAQVIVDTHAWGIWERGEGVHTRPCLLCTYVASSPCEGEGCTTCVEDASHIHTLCGEGTCTHAGDSHTDTVTYIPLTQQNIDKLFEAAGTTNYYMKGGNYYLAEDIVVPNKMYIQIRADEYGITNICLAGHTITFEGTRGFSIFDNNSHTYPVNFCDCSESGTGTVAMQTTSNSPQLIFTSSTLNIYGGNYKFLNSTSEVVKIFYVNDSSKTGSELNLYRANIEVTDAAHQYLTTDYVYMVDVHTGAVCNIYDITVSLPEETAGACYHVWDRGKIGTVRIFGGGDYSLLLTLSDTNTENVLIDLSAHTGRATVTMVDTSLITDRYILRGDASRITLQNEGWAVAQDPADSGFVMLTHTAHTGGEASCTEQAVCDVCAKAYGPFAAHENDGSNHCTVCLELLINEETFPDAAFRTYVLTLPGAENSAFGTAELAAIEDIRVDCIDIYSLKGIEHFTSLCILHCAGNHITALNLSELPNITDFSLGGQTAEITIDQKTMTVDISSLFEDISMVEFIISGVSLNGTILTVGEGVTEIPFRYNTGIKEQYLSGTLIVTNHHTHEYGEIVLPSLLISEATCTEGALYRKSCTCTLASEDTFRTPELAPDNHTFGENDLCPCGAVRISAATFPDELFRKHVSQSIAGAEDGILTKAELAAVREITSRGSFAGRITDLTGIAFFTELTRLDICYNAISSLDLSSNTKLEYLNIGSNGMSSLNLSGCTALTQLIANANSLSSLDLTASTALLELNLNSNFFVSLDISYLTALQTLRICSNASLASLDVSHFTQLQLLDIRYTSIEEIDLSQNRELVELMCDEAPLKTLDLSGNRALKSLQCQSVPLTALDLSGMSSLETLHLANTPLEKLNLSGCTSLSYISLKGNHLTELHLDGASAELSASLYEQTRTVTIEEKTMRIDMSALVTDISRVTVLSGGKLENGYLIVEEGASTVAYTYATGVDTPLSVTLTIANPHTHAHTETVSDATLITPASCLANAVYGKSCTCGNISTETFEVQGFDTDAHAGEATLLVSEENGTHKRLWNCCRAIESEGLACTPIDRDDTCLTAEHCACGATLAEAMEAHAGGNATCTAPALCAACGTAYGDPLGHTFGDWSITTPPACTEQGVETRVCANDASHTETRPLAAIGHTFGDWSVTTPPACTEQGVETRVCANDASHTETRPLTAIGHTFGDWSVTTPSTCTEQGVETRVCVNDASHTETRPLAAQGHDFTVIEQNEEAHWFKCSRCDETNEKVAHTYGDGLCTCGKEEPGLPVGAVVGIAVGSSAIGGIGIFALVWFVFKKKSWADLTARFRK